MKQHTYKEMYRIKEINILNIKKKKLNERQENHKQRDIHWLQRNK